MQNHGALSFSSDPAPSAGPLSPQEVLHFSKKVVIELDSQQEEGTDACDPACGGDRVPRDKAQGCPSRRRHLDASRQAGSRTKQEFISKGPQNQRSLGVGVGVGGVGARTRGRDMGGG